MLNAGGSRSSPFQVEQPLSSAVGATTKREAAIANKQLTVNSTSLLKSLRLVASFFKNFLAFQVETWRQLASEATVAAAKEEKSRKSQIDRHRLHQATGGASGHEEKGETDQADSNMMHNRQVRGVDGFVSRCTVRSPASLTGSETITRENYQKYQEYIRSHYAHHDRPAINQTFDASSNAYHADQLIAATAAFRLQESAPKRHHLGLHTNQVRKPARLGDRSSTIDAQVPGEYGCSRINQHYLKQRQVSEQERFNSTLWAHATMNPHQTFATNRLMAAHRGASSSLPSSNQHTIDQHSSFSTSFDYSTDEPHSLPANLPAAMPAPQPAHMHHALVRANTQLGSPFDYSSNHDNQNHLPRVLHERPNSSMEQRTIERERLLQRQRQHLRQRHTSVEDYYASAQAPQTCSSALLARQSHLNLIKARQHQQQQMFIDKNRPQPTSIGSDSELYNHNHPTKSILQTSDRAYYMHHYSGAARNRSRGAQSVASQTSSTSKISGCSGNPTDSSYKSTGTGQKKSAVSKKTLSLAGAKKRLGFKQSGLSAISVQRSEEVLPLETSCSHLIHHTTTAQSLSDSGTESSFGWISLWQQYQNQQLTASYPAMHQQQKSIPLDPKYRFVEGLGAGQIASRQALVSPYLGDIQLALNDRRGMLEVDVIRARSLQVKAGAKTLPSPYVKVYLMKEKKCIAKCKTSLLKQTLDPLYQQKFIFREEYVNCILQVIVWGDYGKKDRKSLMGIVQIHLDDLDISDLVIGWYKLFNVPSMTSATLSSKALRHMIVTKDLAQQQQVGQQQQSCKHQIELSSDQRDLNCTDSEDLGNFGIN